MAAHSQHPTEDLTLRVVIAGNALAYPRGQGATARMAQYATGLTKIGAEVTILCLKPTSPSADAPSFNPTSGNHDGTKFLYTAGSSVYSKNRVVRYLQNIGGIAGLIKYFLQQRLSGHKTQIVLMYGTDSPLYAYILWICSRIAGAKLVGENTEAPLVYSKRNLAAILIRKINEILTYKLFDGFVVISNPLYEYYSKNLAPNTPLLLLPILVNVEDFAATERGETHAGGTLVYCGNLYNETELEAVLQIWGLAYQRLQHGKLIVIGDNSDFTRMRTVNSVLRKYNIADAVIFTGLIARSDLPKFLSQASANILPRHKGTFSSAGLPNKLGEYLASGRPTIVSAVGDIPLYLINTESAILLDPEDLEGFVNAVVDLLTNERLAAYIGANGRQVARTHFDRDAGIVRLLALFHQTLTQRDVQPKMP